MFRLTLLLFLAATPAAAHHPLAGQPMESFAHGLLSGIGHPILGFDHLFFVLAMGLAARLSGHAFSAPLAYLAPMLIGCALPYAGITLPLTETAIAASLLVLGGLLAANRPLTTPALLAIFAGFGLFHGAGLGASLATAEGTAPATVLTGYLIGLGLVQYALALAAGRAAAAATTALPARLAGAAIAGAGLLLLLEQAEAPLIALLTA